MKIALVAGASSGLGRAVAEALAADGCRVYAGARSFTQGKEPPVGCLTLPLDVTEAESVSGAIDAIIRQEGRIDILVCCAATFTMAPLEELPPETLADMLSVNLIGAARCVQAALPHMRAQGGGHILLFSSLNGLFSIPFQGAYSATKHAIEAYSEALSQETRRYGIRVTVVEPGDCRGGSRRYRLTHIGEGSPYTDAFRRGTGKIAHDEENGLPPERVGRAVARVAAKKNPPARLMVASLEQRFGVWLFRFLPRGVFNRVIAWYYR